MTDITLTTIPDDRFTVAVVGRGDPPEITVALNLDDGLHDFTPDEGLRLGARITAAARVAIAAVEHEQQQPIAPRREIEENPCWPTNTVNPLLPNWPRTPEDDDGD